MNLPAIDIPIPTHLPVEIPLLIHPAIVHFAISLPIILLLIEFINLIMKRKALSVTTVTLIILIGLVFLGAFLTGRADGSEAFALLSPDAQKELKFHKLLGIYLVYSTAVVLLFKIVSMTVKKIWAKILYFLILIAFIALTLFQGKEGGELVYQHGVNVKAVQTLEDKIEQMQESSTAKEEPKNEEAQAPAQEQKEEVVKAKEESKAETSEVKEHKPQAHQEEEAKPTVTEQKEQSKEEQVKEESKAETSDVKEQKSEPAKEAKEEPKVQEAVQTPPVSEEKASEEKSEVTPPADVKEPSAKEEQHSTENESKEEEQKETHPILQKIEEGAHEIKEKIKEGAEAVKEKAQEIKHSEE